MSFIKRIKAVYWINNLLNGKKLDCNEDIYRKYGLKKSTKDFRLSIYLFTAARSSLLEVYQHYSNTSLRKARI